MATETLVELGLPGRRARHADNPTCVHDLVCRVGGYGPGKARTVVQAKSGIEAPERPGIQSHHSLTFRRGGGKKGSGIRNVINDRGGEVIVSERAKVK